MLPPYSRFLTIVEQAISCLKAASRLTSQIWKIEDVWITEMRPEAGESNTTTVLHRNIDAVTAAKSAQWYRFMQTYLPNFSIEIIEWENEIQNKMILE